MDSEEYMQAAGVTGFIAFPLAWIACALSFGMWGVLLGWMPAIAIAFVAGFLWPITWFGVAMLILSIST